MGGHLTAHVVLAFPLFFFSACAILLLAVREQSLSHGLQLHEHKCTGAGPAPQAAGAAARARTSHALLARNWARLLAERSAFMELGSPIYARVWKGARGGTVGRWAQQEACGSVSGACCTEEVEG